MFRRNWLDLSRKLVDRFDLTATLDGIQKYLGEQALSFFGEGVLITTTYPVPFPVSMSVSSLGGTVGNGIAYDINGQITRIDSSSPTSKNFVVQTADPFNPRMDLLCIKYVQAGDTPVPKPSDPITTINLNLHDDFELVVVKGTPSGSPTYPAKGNSLLIVLAGLYVPAGATVGTQVTVDLSVRENALQNLAAYPEIQWEVPAGPIDIGNRVFTVSKQAINGTSLMVRVNGRTLMLGAEWSIIGQQITLGEALAPGQSIDVWYIVNSTNSQNPLSMFQEIPDGVVNSLNPLFKLSGKSISQMATQVFVNGKEAPLDQWDLIQGSDNSSVQFKSGFIPVHGQSVYVAWLFNAVPFGAGPPAPPPSGSGALATFGSAGSPQIISPSIGIHPSADQRQIWFVASGGGAQSITATPQIAPGTVVGQELDIQGTSNVNYPIFQNGNGLSLNGALDLTDNGAISLVWNGSVWSEVSRR